MSCLNLQTFLQWAETDIGAKPNLPDLCLPPPTPTLSGSGLVSVDSFNRSEGGDNKSPSTSTRIYVGTGQIRLPLSLESVTDNSPPPYDYYQEDAFTIISEGSRATAMTYRYRDADGNPVSFSQGSGTSYNIRIYKSSNTTSKLIGAGRFWDEMLTMEGSNIFPSPSWDSPNPTPTPTPTPTPPPCDVPIRNDFEGGYFCLSFSEYNNLINQIDNIEQLLRTYNP
jgi:hypothetical protein